MTYLFSLALVLAVIGTVFGLNGYDKTACAFMFAGIADILFLMNKLGMI